MTLYILVLVCKSLRCTVACDIALVYCRPQAATALSRQVSLCYVVVSESIKIQDKDNFKVS